MNISKNNFEALSITFFVLLGISFCASAQPTPREYRYVWAWNGVTIREQADENSQSKEHLNYGDSVLIAEGRSEPENEQEIEIFGGTVEYGKEFPEWKVKSGWIAVGSRAGNYGFVPEIYLSKRKPFKFNQKTKLTNEDIEEYFVRTRGTLETSIIKKRELFWEEAVRYVFKSGIIYERPYSIYQRKYFTLILPDMTLVEAFMFLNTTYNLEMEKRGGKSDNIRLITQDENSLLFTNTYQYSGVEGNKRKIYFFQKVLDFVVVTIEEIEIN